MAFDCTKPQLDVSENNTWDSVDLNLNNLTLVDRSNKLIKAVQFVRERNDNHYDITIEITKSNAVGMKWLADHHIPDGYIYMCDNCDGVESCEVSANTKYDPEMYKTLKNMVLESHSFSTEVRHRIKEIDGSEPVSLQELYEDVRKLVEVALITAEAKRKPLLILAGESHSSNKSLLIEMMLFQIANEFSIKNHMAESNLLNLIKEPGPWKWNDWNEKIARALNMKLIACDPKHGNTDAGLRQRAMNAQIAEVGEASLAIVGAAHLLPIVKDPKIAEKYHLLVLDVSQLKDDICRTNALFPNMEAVVDNPDELDKMRLWFSKRGASTFAHRIYVSPRLTFNDWKVYLRELYDKLPYGTQCSFPFSEFIAPFKDTQSSRTPPRP